MTPEVSRKKRVFFVIGSTGSQKSKVGVSLAKLLTRYHSLQNVVVVNCDVPQFYDGLPIATNKGNLEDFEGIPHYFLGFLSPDGRKKFSSETPYPHVESPLQSSLERRYNVTHYQKEAVNFIDDHFRQNENTAVIVCGGTCYYAQSIMFSNSLLDDLRDDAGTKTVELVPSKNLWGDLSAVDPEVASRYHPHDTRRIQSLLNIFYEKGVVPSKVFSSKSISLRYPDSYVIWTFVERSVLETKLSERVEQMVERGLLLEVHNFSLANRETEYNGAIKECIGYKEFDKCDSLLEKPLNSSVLNAIDTVKSETCRYARQQLQFIQNRLLPMVSQRIFSPWQLVKFDVAVSTNILFDIQIYSDNVFLNQDKKSISFSFPLVCGNKESKKNTLEKCPICSVYYGEDQLATHITSKKHRGILKRQRLEKDQWEKYGRVLPPPKRNI